jgi:hypothetical protein
MYNLNYVDIKFVTISPYNPVKYQIMSASFKRKMRTIYIETYDKNHDLDLVP